MLDSVLLFVPRDRRIVLVVGVVGELVDQLVELINADRFVQRLVDQHGRGGAAGAEAFQLYEGEFLILRRLADLDIELLHQVLGQVARATDFARQRPADL